MPGVISRLNRRVFFGSAIGMIAGLFVLSSAHAADSIGAVEKVERYAFGTPVDEPRMPLFVKNRVFMDELVETEADSSLHLRFADGSDFHMGANGAVRLDRFIYNPADNSGELTLNLTKGIFRFISGGLKKQGVKLKTPSATMGLRGTDVQIEVPPGSQERFKCIVGSVFVKPNGAGAGVVVTAGQTAVVDGPDSDARIVDATDGPSIGPGTESRRAATEQDPLGALSKQPRLPLISDQSVQQPSQPPPSPPKPAQQPPSPDPNMPQPQ